MGESEDLSDIPDVLKNAAKGAAEGAVSAVGTNAAFRGAGKLLGRAKSFPGGEEFTSGYQAARKGADLVDKQVDVKADLQNSIKKDFLDRVVSIKQGVSQLYDNIYDNFRQEHSYPRI